jgi:predicted acyltransferase
MVGMALVIAFGAMAERTANAASPTVGLGTAARIGGSGHADDAVALQAKAGQIVTATPTFAPTTAPTVAPTSAPRVAGVQTLPSTRDEPVSPVAMLGLALAGIGLLLLLGRPVRQS